MRVLAGIYKSKKIETINNTDTRPMMSRVREAIFNSIQFMVEDKDVLDLYSGSGSLGIEALSRKANYVTFVELSKECILILKKNVENMSSNLSVVNSLLIIHRHKASEDVKFSKNYELHREKNYGQSKILILRRI